MKKKPGNQETSITRSSAAEYLTFITAKGEGGVEAVYANEDVWLSQKMMAVLYDVDVRTINYHLQKVFKDSELEANAVIRKFRITAADGKTYQTQHYNLSAIIAVGYKVNSERAVQFRKWATTVLWERGGGDGMKMKTIHPQITQMGADSDSPKNICANLRNLRINKALNEILEKIGVVT